MNVGTLTGEITLEDHMSHALELVTHHVKEFAEGFEGVFGAVAVAAGVVVTAIGTIAGSIVGLGIKGSTLLGVEEAFDHLAQSAGSTGEALRGALSRGVKGTVDEMQLMQATTRLLSSGMKVSEKDMLLMAQTAREMGKATGTDATNGLSVLSQAMLTGNDRALKRYGIQVDLAKAETEFAASIGKTKDQLSQSGKVEANRIAILEAMRVKMSALGESELSFKERIQQVEVGIEEWFSSLAKATAASPHVLNAFDKIADALRNAFGDTSQTLLEMAVSWINRFADAAAKYGPMIVGIMSDMVQKVKDLYHEVMNAWDTAPEWFRNIAKDAVVAGVAVKGVEIATHELTGTDVLGVMANLAQVWSVVGVNIGKAATAMKEWVQMVAVFKGEAVALALESLGTAIGSIVATPLFTLAAGIAAVYAAFKIGQMKEVQDFFEALELYAEGMSMAEAKAAVAQHRMFDAATEQANGLAALRKKIEADARALGHGGPLPPPPPPPPPPNLTVPTPSAYDAFSKSLTELTAHIDEAQQHHMVLNEQVNQFGEAAQKAADDAKSWGVKVKSSVMDVANADFAKKIGKALEDSQKEITKAGTAFAIDQKYKTEAEAKAEAKARGDSLDAQFAMVVDFHERNYQATLTNVGKELRLNDLARAKAVADLKGRFDDEGPLYQEGLQQIYQFYSAQAAMIATNEDETDQVLHRTRDRIRSAFGDVGTILDAIPGKFAEIGAMAARAGGAIMDNLANGNLWGAVIAGATAAIGILGKLFGIGPTEYEKRMKKAVEDTQALQKTLIAAHGNMSTLIADAARVGINIKEALTWKDNPDALKTVIADLDAKLAKLDSGIQMFTSGAAKKLDAFFHSFDKVRDLKEKNKDLLSTIDEQLAGEAPEEVAGIAETQAREVLKGIHSAWLDQLGGTADDVQKEYARLGLYAGTAFAETLREHGWQAAIEAAGPMFDQLQSLHDEFGFQLEGSAKAFQDFYNTVKNNQDVLVAVSGLTDMIKGSTDALFINQELFDAFESDALAGYTRLTERGIDSNQAMVLMQPTLQALWEAQQKFHFETDSATQALIDQGVQQGIIGETSRDVNQQILDVLKGIARVFGVDIPDASQKAADAITDHVGGALDELDGRTVHIKYDSEFTTPDTENPQYHASGGKVLAWRPRGTDTVPAMLTPGETVIPAGRSQMPITVPITLKVGNETLAKQVVKTFVQGGL